MAILNGNLDRKHMKKKSSFSFLNATQFLGALNDNLFKILIVFLLINIEGTKSANLILSLVGFLFVLPFLLFSQIAGIIADKHSKKKIIVATKWLEVVIACIGVFAFYYHLKLLAYIMLFLMATQSTFFSPAKYGIVPELVPQDRVIKANGYLSSFTYIAIIVGTFLASFLTDITDKHLTMASLFCVFVAIIGLITSFLIQWTPKAGSKKKIHPFFLKELIDTLKFCKTRPFLLTAVFSSAYFLFIGAFVQLNIIPFTLQALHMDETKGGYLFLLCAVGIALGSFFTGKVHKFGKFTLSFVGALGIGIFCLNLALFSHYLIPSMLNLVILGLFGGMFIVPMDSFIQIDAPKEKRGQIIGANTFLSFFGVLVASFLLFILEPFESFSAVLGFIIIGICTLGVAFWLLRTDIEDIFHRVAKFVLRWFYDKPNPIQTTEVSIYRCEQYSKEHLFRIIGSLPDTHPCIHFHHGKHWFTRLFGLQSNKISKLKNLLESDISLLFFDDQFENLGEITSALKWGVHKRITIKDSQVIITNENEYKQ